MSQEQNDNPWEEAYLRFETPEEERKKFRGRLLELGIKKFEPNSKIIEICCGRANGLVALKELGFTNLLGLDLSESLLKEAPNGFELICADCRDMPLDSESIDIAIVQGGLHHLFELPKDLDNTLKEISRVLKREGSLLVVEPWDTPFLRFVHFVIRFPIVRKISNKCDALQVMTEHEYDTYYNWLSRSEEIEGLFRKHFSIKYLRKAFGKIKLRASKS